jgi:membrane protease YdiL (CAAX protease family)
VIPFLRDAFGTAPIIGWYISGTTLVLVPILLYGCMKAWQELSAQSAGGGGETRHGLDQTENSVLAVGGLHRGRLDSLRKRLRVNAITHGDIGWAAGGLVLIMAGTAAILVVARSMDPNFRPSPWFLQQPPGWHVWVFAAWVPLFVTNILAEELCWRGYLLPRQEARLGRIAWLPNGILWCLFHWSFGWAIMVTLLPITLLLPWIVQHRRNTSVGIVIHAVFNAAGFVAVASGAGN